MLGNNKDRLIFPKKVLSKEIDLVENTFFDKLFGENWETEGEKNIEQTFEFVKTITISRNLANNTLLFKLYKVQDVSKVENRI